MPRKAKPGRRGRPIGPIPSSTTKSSATSITSDLADGTQAVEFYLEGVHCAACVWLVEKLPQVRPGVIESRLDMRRAIVEVRWDPEVVKLSQIAGTLDSLGYPPHPAKDIHVAANAPRREPPLPDPHRRGRGLRGQRDDAGLRPLRRRLHRHRGPIRTPLPLGDACSSA